MAITGITFDNQIPTAKALRGAFKSALTDGIISGCNITYSGRNITIAAGLITASGGIFQISGTEQVSVTGSSGYARVKVVINLSGAATEQTFSQVSFAVDYANSATGFTSLVQQDINTGSGTTYEAELCVVSLASSGISGIVRTATAESKILYGNSLPADAPEGTIFLLKV